MKKIRILAVCDLIALLVQLGMSWLVQSRTINAKDVGQVSGEHPTLFTPAGITFAIWGLIYLLLAVFCIYHLIMAWRQRADHPANRDQEAIGGLFIINNLFTAAWLYTWTQEWIAASLVLICFQLITLIAMNARLHIYNTEDIITSKVCTQIPLAVYFGWITIATIANTDVYLSVIGWDRMGISAERWTMMLIGLAVFITILVVLVRRNIAYGLVVIWALAGIFEKQTADRAVTYPQLLLAIEIGMIVVGIVCVLQLARNRFRHRSIGRVEARWPVAPHPLK